ncbi:MAG: sulfurtransferase [Balneolaceae bacterium]
MIRTLIIPILIFVSVQFACTRSQVDSVPDHYPNSSLLIEASELNTRLEQSDLFLIDTRSETVGKFIPGAIHFQSVERLSDPDHPVDGYLIPAEEFESLMRELGLNRDDRVVIYDDGNALRAARLFYALEYHGFSNASILNGGWSNWQKEGYPVSEAIKTSSGVRGNFMAEVQEERICTFDEIREASQNPDKVILDVRSAEEYEGTRVRAERGGHIPNAVNLEWSQVIESGDVPKFLPASQIQAKYDVMGITRDKEVIPHCQSNVRASHAYFTLRLMGYDSVRPYEGSWAEYGNREDAVIEGPES